VAHRIDNLVAVSGRLGVSAPGVLVGDSFEDQCRQAFRNLDAALLEVGAIRRDVIQVVAYLTDGEDRSTLNVVYAEYFQSPRPARTCVGAAWLPFGGKVEIQALALVGAER